MVRDNAESLRIMHDEEMAELDKIHEEIKTIMKINKRYQKALETIRFKCPADSPSCAWAIATDALYPKEP